MSTWQRLRFAFISTIASAVGAILYTQVFSQVIFPMVDKDGLFSTPVIWLDRLVPLILAAFVLLVWIWVIAGAVQDERTVDRRRVRR